MSICYDQLVPVVFGEGAVHELGEKVRALGCRRVLCVYGQSVKASGIAQKALNALQNAGIETVIFDKVSGEPDDQLVDECGALALAESVDGVVGIGGGSSMDCAKAASLLLKYPAPIRQYFTAPPSFLEAPVPVILVPTTAGTGSEVTQVSVITKLPEHHKPAIFMRPALAVVDPELTYSSPASVTAYAGFDAFAHAAESITAKGRNERSELLAMAAIEKIAVYLPRVLKDPMDKEARHHLSLASNWAGIAFADTDCHLGHAMADGLSAGCGTPHGLNCIWINPELMAECAIYIPEEVKKIGLALGGSYRGDESAQEIGEITAGYIRDLMEKCQLPTPSEKGITSEQMQSCAATVMEIDLGLRLNCPFEATEEIVRQIYRKSFERLQNSRVDSI
ncbi:MAG: iron-containing alcohol dehydrogenase [Parasporobacterium sp.]|nr:iron-containing alcohol dehydrogenase [Parasporobacterium sp.]